MKKNTSNNQANSLENISWVIDNAVVISAILHSDPRYEAFYQKIDDVSELGRIGIYQLCTDMAIVISEYENDKENFWDNYEWTEFAEYFTDSVIEYGLEGHRIFQPDLEKMMSSALSKSSR